MAENLVWVEHIELQEVGGLMAIKAMVRRNTIRTVCHVLDPASDHLKHDHKSRVTHSRGPLMLVVEGVVSVL